jgi:N-acetylglutamate synthase-like GNAT family acetyltransferase
MRVRAATPADRDWIGEILDDVSARRVARNGELVEAFDHPMLIAETDEGPAGVLTYIVRDDTCEILTLHAIKQWRGAGTALIARVRSVAAEAGCHRLWLVTTNDNVDALRFYQRRGFRLVVLRPGAVDDARRRLKPGIPEIGDHAIPLRDELELEMEP